MITSFMLHAIYPEKQNLSSDLTCSSNMAQKGLIWAWQEAGALVSLGRVGAARAERVAMLQAGEAG
jgi:hypothetical protein